MNQKHRPFTDSEIEEIRDLHKDHGWGFISRKFNYPYSTFYSGMVAAGLINGNPKPQIDYKHQKKKVKSYKEICREKGIDLSKYKKNQQWGGG